MEIIVSLGLGVWVLITGLFFLHGLKKRRQEYKA